MRACFNHSPAQVAPMVQQETDGADGDEDQEHLLLRHLSLCFTGTAGEESDHELRQRTRRRCNEKAKLSMRWNKNGGKNRPRGIRGNERGV